MQSAYVMRKTPQKLQRTANPFTPSTVQGNLNGPVSKECPHVHEERKPLRLGIAKHETLFGRMAFPGSPPSRAKVGRRYRCFGPCNSRRGSSCSGAGAQNR